MYQSYKDFLFNLEAMTSSEAKRLHRQAIIAHFNSKCVYCGIKYEPNELTLDHVKPRCRGGDSFTKNLVPSCTACNRSKGSSNWLTWMRQTFGITTREHLILQHIR